MHQVKGGFPKCPVDFGTYRSGSASGLVFRSAGSLVAPFRLSRFGMHKATKLNGTIKGASTQKAHLGVRIVKTTR